MKSIEGIKPAKSIAQPWSKSYLHILIGRLGMNFMFHHSASKRIHSLWMICCLKLPEMKKLFFPQFSNEKGEKS
jgi:hypothetical protein